jgi:hypothetical protein
MAVGGSSILRPVRQSAVPDHPLSHRRPHDAVAVAVFTLDIKGTTTCSLRTAQG